ncbi:MAG: hypothetical protein AAGI23_12035 [Bacteroidota bacterium]
MKTQTVKKGNSKIKVTPYGGGGGNEFPRQVIKELGLQTGKYVDQIRINDNRYGGRGGEDKGSIILAEGDYIHKVEINANKYVDQVHFETKAGLSIGGGRDGGYHHELSNVRVLAIGGRAHKLLDKLDIMYIENYVPSELIQEHAGFIIAYDPPGTEFTEYTRTFYKQVDAYSKITKSMINQEYSVNVEGEYYVKVSAGAKIEIKSAKIETISNELTQELEHTEGRKVKVEADHVGVSLITGNIMKGADGHHWMYPTNNISYSIIRLDDVKAVANHYDLTRQLSTQMPLLQDKMEDKYGYIYYE